MMFLIFDASKALHRLVEVDKGFKDRLTLCNHPIDSAKLISKEFSPQEQPQCIYLDPMYPAGESLVI